MSGPGALRRGPALFVSGPGAPSLCRGPALFVSGPGALCRGPALLLCVEARRSLFGARRFVSGPGVLCVGAQRCRRSASNKNPAGRRRRRFQYQSCTTREGKSSRPPDSTKVVLPEKEKPAPAVDRCSSMKILLSETENPAGCARRSFQYELYEFGRWRQLLPWPFFLDGEKERMTQRTSVNGFYNHGLAFASHNLCFPAAINVR